MKIFKSSYSSSIILFCLSLYFTFVLNISLYKTLLQDPSIGTMRDNPFLLTVPLFVFCVLFAFFQIIAIPFLHKIIIPLLLIISAAISYNSFYYQVYFNTDMLENVLQTTNAEASKLLTTNYILWVLCLGIIPAVIYILAKVNYKPWYKEIAVRILWILLSLSTIGIIAKFYYQDYASFIRNHKQISHIIVPSNFIASGINKIKRVREQNRPYQQIGLDAKRFSKNTDKKNIFILVVGETTRAANWGLNGYQRQTTPQLAALGESVINYRNVTSCGTATAVSVPCMFSVMNRDNYNGSIAAKQDNVLDIISRTGINIVWLDNDSGCKGVCTRITNKIMDTKTAKYCKDGECLDDILLDNIDEYIHSDSPQDLLLVLHTMGSHGPTYYQRYSNAFKQFTPTCDTHEIAKCDNEQLVNTYDNGILYIDHLLTQLINKLKNSPEYHSALYYLSDHGESLGEKGMYLHGAPYAIAPNEQKEVPQILWLSPSMEASKNIDTLCLRNHAENQQYSHDNLFHSLLGFFDIQTEVYKKELDIFSGCRK